MNTVFGLLAFVLFISIVVGVAAGVTLIVVKVSPKKKPDAAPKS